MQIDFYNEIMFKFKKMYYIIKKENVTENDTENLLLLNDDIRELLELYLYDFLCYRDYYQINEKIED